MKKNKETIEHSQGPSSSHLRKTPPSREALRHSGGDRRRCTSPTVTLYLEVELSSERRPGTEQKTSAGLDTAPIPRPSLPRDKADKEEPFSLDGIGTGELKHRDAEEEEGERRRLKGEKESFIELLFKCLRCKVTPDMMPINRI